MEKCRAIPRGFMTVGEIAKKMGVTVRTMQYYDREGILTPSSESEGGRRLYTFKDVVKLHQILSMKYLGFSLEDIKTRLPSINTPQEVSALLMGQAEGIRAQINDLGSVLQSIEKHDFDTGSLMNEKYKQIIEKSAKTQKDGHAPESEQGMALAKQWWDYVDEVTGGDLGLLSKLIEMGKGLDNNEWTTQFSFDKTYLEKALVAYFTSIGYNPYNLEGGRA